MALLLREKDVRTLLNMRDAVAVLEEAFIAYAQGQMLNQPRSRLQFPQGVLTYLAAAAPDYGVFGHKTYTSSREGVRFLITLYSAVDGQLLALIEASWLGAMRTGAASALATLHLSRPESSVIGLIGAGNQALTQLMGMCAVRQVTDVLVYCRNQHERDFFCQQMQRRLSVQAHPVKSIQQAVEAADILITATTAGEPILDGNWLQPGCHINAIGSNWAQRRELDSRTLQRCAIISTDSLEQAYIEAGDLLIPIQEGNLRWDDVYELAAIINGEGPQRELPEDITLFKSLGVALEDIATAAHVYTLACQQGLGEEIDLLS